MRRVCLLGLLLAIVAASPLAAVCVVRADGPDLPAPTAEAIADYATFLAEESGIVEEPSLTSVLVGVVWKLGLVVLLAYGALWVAKRVSVRRVAAGGQQLQVLETMTLGTNRNLYVVRVGAQILLIGATAQEVRLLADVSGSYDSDEPWGEAEAAGPDAGNAASGEARTLMPSLEAVERVRDLWRRGQS